MSFSSDLRAEIARIIPSSRRDRDTAIAVLIANLCTFGTADDGCVQMYFSSGNLPAVRKCFTLIQKNVNIRPDLLTPKLSGEDRDPEKRKTGAGRADHDVQAFFPETVSTESPQIVNLPERLHFPDRDGGLRTQDGTLDPALVNGNRSRSYLREMFLCTGFMNDPAKS